MTEPMAVLAIGLDPREADFSAMPHLTAESIRAYVEAQVDRIRDLGVEVELRLLTSGPEGPAEIEAALRARAYACIVIGAGLRNAQSVEHVILLEAVMNHIHRLAPRSKIAFNATPADTIDVVRRALGGG